jgi:predicted esterase
MKLRRLFLLTMAAVLGAAVHAGCDTLVVNPPDDGTEDTGDENTGDDTGTGPAGDAGGGADAGGGDDTGAGYDAASDGGGGGSDAGGDGGVKDGGTKDGGVTACGPLNEGYSTFKVGTLDRTVIINYPNGVESGGPWPVIFNWHGLGDSASNMAGIVKGYINNANYPFILVTPEDTDFVVLGYNMDWEVFKVNTTTNREALLFDKVLGCLKQKVKVDDNRIHSIGFSMGSIVTDMLGTIRGAQLASILTFSGAYFSDQANVDSLVTLLKSQVSWPAPNHSNGYAQVLLHGGTSDNFNMYVQVVQFDTFNNNDKTYLNGLGHDVVICNHNAGHTAPRPDFQAPQILEFLKAHPRGTVNSPYAGGLPGDYPGYCTFSGKK